MFSNWSNIHQAFEVPSQIGAISIKHLKFLHPFTQLSSFFHKKSKLHFWFDHFATKV